jgi:hypothetical protein
VEKILHWENTSPKQVEIPFKPAHVILQDFTGVPAVVDIDSMRDGMKRLGGDANKINPLVPVDLVIDHSVQVDVARSENALHENMEFEFNRNRERFGFLKWGSFAFKNMLIVPPGSLLFTSVSLEESINGNLLREGTRKLTPRWILGFIIYLSWDVPVPSYYNVIPTRELNGIDDQHEIGFEFKCAEGTGSNFLYEGEELDRIIIGPRRKLISSALSKLMARQSSYSENNLPTMMRKREFNVDHEGLST